MSSSTKANKVLGISEPSGKGVKFAEPDPDRTAQESAGYAGYTTPKAANTTHANADADSYAEAYELATRYKAEPSKKLDTTAKPSGQFTAINSDPKTKESPIVATFSGQFLMVSPEPTKKKTTTAETSGHLTAMNSDAKAKRTTTAATSGPSTPIDIPTKNKATAAAMKEQSTASKSGPTIKENTTMNPGTSRPLHELLSVEQRAFLLSWVDRAYDRHHLDSIWNRKEFCGAVIRTYDRHGESVDEALKYKEEWERIYANDRSKQIKTRRHYAVALAVWWFCEQIYEGGPASNERFSPGVAV